MNGLQKLFSNTVLALVANAIAKVSGSLLFILVGRQIGPQEAGIFNLGVTYYTILLALSTLGLHELLVREVAPRRDQSNRYLLNYVAMRLASSAALYLGLLLFLQLNLPYSDETKSVLRIMSLAIFPEAVFSLCQALFIAHERQAVPTLSALVNAVLRLSLGIVLLQNGAGAVGIAWVIPVSTALSLILFPPAVLHLSRRVAQTASSRLDWRFGRRQLGLASGFILLAVFETLNFQADTFIISFLMTSADLGYYGASQTIVAGALMVPVAIRMALYPLMARAGAIDQGKLARLYRKSSQYLVLLALPMAAGIMVLAEPIISLLFGEAFAPAILPLQISIWAVVFALVTVPNARMMLVHGKQTQASWLRGIGMVASVALNLLLIPILGINGAAIARVLATALFFLSLYVYVQRHFLRESRLLPMIRPVIATFIMASAVWFLRAMWLPLPIITGVLVYGGTLLLLGGITSEDRAYLRQLIDFRPALEG